MDEIILHKLLTLEVIVETIIDELIDKKLIDADTFDVALIEKIKEIDAITKVEKTEFDYSKFFMGPKGEA
tara:strand:- start:566 stop:775 length:210 start_codon:yes stop_codon:yes gene_type:complete